MELHGDGKGVFTKSITQKSEDNVVPFGERSIYSLGKHGYLRRMKLKQKLPLLNIIISN